jgi:hypothetical protein
MFSYFKPKLIQFDNGKFGIIKHTFLGSDHYLGDNNYWWTPKKEYVEKYCQFDTEEKAVDAYMKEYMSNQKIKHKVIATLDDEWDL